MTRQLPTAALASTLGAPAYHGGSGASMGAASSEASALATEPPRKDALGTGAGVFKVKHR